MKRIDFWITAKTIFQQVQHETTLIALTCTDQQGQQLYTRYVMDSDHLLLFRSYFQEARANTLTKFTAYTKHQPLPNGEDTDDTTGKDEDFFVTLLLPADFPTASASLLHNLIYEHLTAWTLYRWFETKLPQEAAIFRQRAQQKLNEIPGILEHRIRPARRRYRLF